MATRAAFLFEITPRLKRAFMQRLEHFNINYVDTFRAMAYNFLYWEDSEIRAFLVKGRDRELQERLKLPVAKAMK